MANDVSKLPFVIDTAGAGAIIATDMPLRIKSITWSHQSTPGDSAVITDANDVTIMEFTEQMAGTQILLNNPHFYRGLKVPTLSGGKLIIEVA